MESMVRAILDSNHEVSLKLQLISHVCKHSSVSDDTEIKSLWRLAIETSMNGPSAAYLAGSEVLILYLRKIYFSHRNEALLTVLKTKISTEIDLTMASNILSTLRLVLIDASSQSSGAWGLSVQSSMLDWFLSLCLKYENEWNETDQKNIASIWVNEELLSRIGTGDLASRLLNAGLTWISAKPANKHVDIAPLSTFVLSLSRGELNYLLCSWNMDTGMMCSILWNTAACSF
jgi:hypothetical protein